MPEIAQFLQHLAKIQREQKAKTPATPEILAGLQEKKAGTKARLLPAGYSGQPAFVPTSRSLLAAPPHKAASPSMTEAMHGLL